MALDIYVTESATPASQVTRPALSLENDGYYWAIAPYLGGLPSLTGHGVDLYSDAVFDRTLLPTLRSALAKAQAAFADGPPTITVHVGTQLRPVRREVTQAVPRKSLLALITRLDELAREAETSQTFLVFVGD